MIDTLIPTPLLSFAPGGFGPGDHTDETILVDLPTLQETRLLIYGTSGSGKTTALYALLQQTYGAVQHIIVDKEGSFPKLREHFDYLLVSGDGEVPLDLSPGAVEVVLRKILETRVNAIIDLSDLVPSDQHEYVRRMATMMAHLSIKSPLAEHDKLVLVDEFQHFAPERGQGNASSTEAMMQLASLARKRGFCLVGATTRISLLSKSIVEMMDNKMIGRCGLDDAARAAQWLNFTKGQRRELSNLSTGTFYAFGPAISTDPVLVRSQSDLLVLPPRRGERRSTPATPAAVRDVLGAFDDIAREAETEARTIEELQTQVDTLTRQLRKAEKATAPVVDVEAVHREARQLARIELEEFRNAAVLKLETVQNFARGLRDESIRLDGMIEDLADSLHLEPVEEIVNPEPVDPRPALAKAREGLRTPTPEYTWFDALPEGTKLGKTPLKILNALHMLELYGVEPAPRDVVGGMVGVVADSGTMRTYLSQLRNEELVVDYPAHALGLSEKGRTLASGMRKPETRRELHDIWLGSKKMGGTPRRMLEILIHTYPDTISKQALCAEVGVKANTGTMRTYLSKLRTPGLMVDVGGELRAADMLFPKGLKP